MIGTKYGKWTIISDKFTKDSSNGKRIECKCDCGTIKSVLYNALINARSAQCSKCSLKNNKKLFGGRI